MAEINDETKNKIQELIDDKILPASMYKELWNTRKTHKLIKLIKPYLTIEPKDQDKIVLYIAYNINNNYDDALDSKEFALLIELLKNQGLIVKSKTKIMNQHMTRTACQKLEERGGHGIIMKIPIGNRDHIIFLNPFFLKDVKK